MNTSAAWVVADWSKSCTRSCDAFVADRKVERPELVFMSPDKSTSGDAVTGSLHLLKEKISRF